MEGFEAFWRAYPRRIGKRVAEIKYRGAIKGGATHEAIMAGVAQYVRWIAREKKAMQYVAHPATWLYQGRWEDELDPPKAVQPAAKLYEPERPLSDAERQKVASMFDGLDSRLKPRRA